MTSRVWRGLTIAGVIAAWGVGGAAVAQDAEAPPEDEAPPAQLGVETAVEQEAPREQEAPPGPLFERRPAPPVLVAVIGGRRVPDDVVAAARGALVEQLGPMARGREVRAIEAEETLEVIAACEGDERDACIGGQLATAGGQAGAILRIERARRGYAATLELRDPVSGAPRREPVEGELPRAADEVPEALAALSGQLADAMPSPPPPPATLTVTVDVDGARVQIDGHDIGESPVAPVDIAEGTHEVVVMAPGFAAVRRQARVRAGEQARVDVTLRALDPAEAAASTQGTAADPDDPWRQDDGGGDVTGEWWFWTIIGVGAAAVIGLAIGIGVAATSGPDEPMVPTQPDGIPIPSIVGGF